MVTSGAVALGRQHLGVTEGSRGAAAALGMSDMTNFYEQLFEQCGLRSAAVSFPSHPYA